jgi:transposase
MGKSLRERFESKVQRAAGNHSIRMIAAMFGVNQGTISHVVNGKSWRCIESKR